MRNRIYYNHNQQQQQNNNKNKKTNTITSTTIHTIIRGGLYTLSLSLSSPLF